MTNIDPGVAAVVAALVAASVAVLSWISQGRSDRETRAHVDAANNRQEQLQRELSGITSAQIRKLADRDQWWARFSWALKRAIGSNARESEVGLALLSTMIDLPWATEDDNKVTATIGGLFRRSSGGDTH